MNNKSRFNMSKFFLFMLISYFLSYTFLQSDDVNEQKIKEANYYKLLEENAFKDSINGVYIPKDLYEAMDILDETVSESMKTKIKAFVNKGDLESYENEPRLNLNSWPLHGNSRISHYLDSIGFSNNEAQGELINNAFRTYLNDETYSIAYRTYKDFLKDSNIFIHFENNYTSGKKTLNGYLSIINKDTSGKFTFYDPFEKSSFFDYKQATGDTSFSNSQAEDFDYSSQDFLELLSDYFDEHSSIFRNGCSWDSLLFINDYQDNDFLLSRFSKYLLKDNIDRFMETEKYLVYYNVGRGEIDSIDNILLNYSITAIKDGYYNEDEKWSKYLSKVMEDFLSNKKYADFYVIRFYPYIKFDFKEYKKKKRKHH